MSAASHLFRRVVSSIALSPPFLPYPHLSPHGLPWSHPLPASLGSGTAVSSATTSATPTGTTGAPPTCPTSPSGRCRCSRPSPTPRGPAATTTTTRGDGRERATPPPRFSTTIGRAPPTSGTTPAVTPPRGTSRPCAPTPTSTTPTCPPFAPWPTGRDPRPGGIEMGACRRPLVRPAGTRESRLAAGSGTPPGQSAAFERATLWCGCRAGVCASVSVGDGGTWADRVRVRVCDMLSQLKSVETAHDGTVPTLGYACTYSNLKAYGSPPPMITWCLLDDCAPSPATGQDCPVSRRTQDTLLRGLRQVRWTTGMKYLKLDFSKALSQGAHVTLLSSSPQRSLELCPPESGLLKNTLGRPSNIWVTGQFNSKA